MKLRIRGDTIRLRLTRPEVDALRDHGRVEETTRFPGDAVFRYALEVGSSTTATFTPQGIVVTIARADADRWCTSEEVGIEAEAPPLRLLVEKDFACVKPRSDEDPAEMYPHPSQSTRSAPE